MTIQRELQCFKWTGSKWLIANDINPLIPETCENYIEPFLGGGAILLSNSTRFKNLTGSDLYEPLIKLWELLRDDPKTVIERYKNLWHELRQEVEELDLDRDRGKNHPKLFYRCREEFNQKHDPFLLLFLSKTCINGVIRFSKTGKFNNSFHHGRLGQKPESFAECVKNLSGVIQSVKFKSADAFETIENATKKDFVFLDPPYFSSNNRYIENYSIDQLESLLEYLNKRGAKWICTYDSRNHAKISRHLYTRHVVSSTYQSRIRRVSGQGVQNTSESIYMNY